MPALQSVVSLTPQTKTAVLNEEEHGIIERIAAAQTPKSFLEIVEESPADELRTLTVLKRLHEHGVLLATAMAEEKRNGDYFALLKQRREQNYGEALNLSARLERLLTAQEETAPRVHERRRMNRRFGDRRQNDRRRGMGYKEETPLFLKKSELLMLREKLARE
jgi:hypothetical protein